jgi:Domain of unknown function (DUF4352)
LQGIKNDIIHEKKEEYMRCLLFIALLTAVITAGCFNTIPTHIFRPDAIESEFGSAYSDSEQAVTVFSAQKTKTFTSIFFNVSTIKEAANGNTFVIIDAQIQNIGAERITVIPHRFSIVDSEGNRFEKEPYHGTDWLMAGELYKNQYKKGKVLFEIPQNSKDLILYYDMNGKILYWKIM